VEPETSRTAFHVTGYSRARFIYCRADNAEVGFLSQKHATAVLQNCCADTCDYGAAAVEKATMEVEGNNFFLDGKVAGLTAYLDSVVSVNPWDEHPSDYCTLEIRTTATALRRNYAAILVKLRSTVAVSGTGDEALHPGVAIVKIIKEDPTLQETYYGIKLESKSLFSGAANVIFKEADTNDGKDTVPVEYQFKDCDEDTMFIP